MSREEAANYIAALTLEEKRRLNDLLKVIEQNRQPSAHTVEK